ncbi:MAG: S8 family serine peptidase, partial [Pseudobdellovibrio sp.]
RAEAAGVIFVAAAANDGKNNDKVSMYPANAAAISVAASNQSDAKPSWSNYGKANVALAAPGEGIMSSLPNDKYGNLSGTSMATPLVAGLVAFLKAQDPNLTSAEVKALLQSTGAKVNIETACNCRIDAFAAVDTLLSNKAWMIPTAATIEVNATQQFTVKNANGAVKFESSNPAVATITEQGLLTGVTQGSVIVKGTDAAGNVVSSLDINVGMAASNNPDPGQPGMPMECPLNDPMLCEALCQFMPQLPWCNQ